MRIVSENEKSVNGQIGREQYNSSLFLVMCKKKEMTLSACSVLSIW